MTQLEREIEQRKTSEVELSRPKNASEAKFHHLFGQFAVDSVEIEVSARRMLRVSRKYCEIMGYDPDERGRMNLDPVALVDDIRTGLLNTTGGDGPAHELVLAETYTRKDGTAVWVNINVSPLREAGEPPGMHIAIVEDISERKSIWK